MPCTPEKEKAPPLDPFRSGDKIGRTPVKGINADTLQLIKDADIVGHNQAYDELKTKYMVDTLKANGQSPKKGKEKLVVQMKEFVAGLSEKDYLGKGFGRPKKNNNLIPLGEALIDENQLNKNKIALYDAYQQPILKYSVSEGMRYLIEDMIRGNYNADEVITKDDYDKLQEILDITMLPDPYKNNHIRRSSIKGKPTKKEATDAVLKEKYLLLKESYKNGNDAAATQIIQILKEFYKRGLLNKRQLNDGVKLYENSIY